MLHMDYETRSEIDLPEFGLHNYATDKSTKVLMLAYAFGEEEPRLWLPHESPLPKELEDAFRNSDLEISAFSSTFERYITKFVLGYDIPISRWQDPQASARYLSLPAHLKDVGYVLGLPAEFRKDERGSELIKLFSLPQIHKKKDGGGIYFNDHRSHPAEFITFGEYCKQDVRAEREIERRERLLGAFPLPPRERRVWIFDQKVNDRGMPTDRVFVENAFNIATDNKREQLKKQNKLTGLENANSTTQLLPWVQERGYPLSNLRKQNIELVLKDKKVDLIPECRDVLNARLEAGSTSYKKLESILRNISPDGRLRNQFIYMGSPRCGRWSGNAVQLHNMARPEPLFEDLDNVEKARFLIYGKNYEGLKGVFKDEKKNTFYSPLIVIKNVIRTVFVAPAGKRLNVCDLKSIETVVGAWVAGCESLLQVFRDGKDSYLDFAVKMTGIPYEKLDADIHSDDKRIKALAKRIRQIAKPGVLGAIYRLGAGGWGKDKNGDTIKTGLWGYAEAMGIDMTQEEAAQVVKIFRESYPEICAPPNYHTGFEGGIWYVLENAVKDVLLGQRVIRKVGPDGCIVIDKITIEGRDPMLRIKLPSGRYLHYLDASIQERQMPWNKRVIDENGVEYEQAVYRPSFVYYGKDQTTDQWTEIKSHGGKIFENAVQAIARDVLADKLLEFEEAGLECVGHVHDEGICLSDDDPFAPGVDLMVKIMSTPVNWAPTLPLGADGFESYFYHK